MSRIRFAFVTFAVLLLVSGAWGQGATSAIVGTVTDPQGQPIGGAKISISDAASSIKRETQTDSAGYYQFLALQPGTYKVRVVAQGFRAGEVSNVEALVSTTPRVDVKLELGSVNETVTVSEAPVAQINTVDATIGNAFDSKQILSLPFEGRDAAAVLSLQPGVSFIGSSERIKPTDTVDTRNGAMNGGRSDQANITLDGVDNNTQTTGAAFLGAVRSTLDSIEEFRVTTAGINADQGRSSGGQVTLLTKGGTNSFHGSAYEQNRSAIGVANDWFNKHQQLGSGLPNKPPVVEKNVFGGSMSGPIWKDRLFFFGTYEGLRQNEAQEVVRSVPGLGLRDGVVQYPCATPGSCLGGTITGLDGKSFNYAPGTFAVGPTQIAQMDPNCSGKGTCPNGNGVNLAAAAIFQKYPTPTPNVNTCTNGDGFNIACVSFSSPLPLHENTSIAKLDYNINRSGTHRVFVRGNYQTDANAAAQQFLGGAPTDVARDTSRALAIGYSGVFTPNLVNTFHYGYTRQSTSHQGLQTLPLVSFRFLDDLTPATSTRNSHIPVHNFVDDVSWTKGKHTLQFGTNLRVINNVRTSNATSYNAALINPLYLNAAPAGHIGSLDPSCIADANAAGKPVPAFCTWAFPAVDPNNLSVYNNSIIDLVGIVSQVTGNYNRNKTATLAEGQAVPRHFRDWEYDVYAQDTWHLKSNLTVTAGLRYTILEPPYETSGTQAAPNLSLHDFVDTRARLQAQGQVYSPTFGFDLSGQANNRKPYWGYDFKDLGPRFSIAYSPSASGGLLKSLFGGPGKSSIRGGFGIVYDHFGQGIVNSFDQNGTFGLSTSITNGASVQTVDGGARFTDLHTIPTSSADGVLLSPAPSGGFPAIPPSGSGFQQIAFGLDDKLKTPYSELVDFAFSRELPGGLIFQAAYVGRFAHRLLQQRDLAMPLNLKDPKSGMDYFAAATAFSKTFYAQGPNATIATIPYWENLFPAAAGSCGAGTSATQCMYELYAQGGNIGPGGFGETNALNIFDASCSPSCLQLPGQAAGGVPFQFFTPQYTALYAWSSIGFSTYNAAQFTLRSQPIHGVQFDFNYTYGNSIDVGSDAERAGIFGGLSGIVNTWSPYQLRSPSDFDTRHGINTNFIAQLPFGHGRRFGHSWNRGMDMILGGWELSGIGRWSSGLPFSVGNGGTFPTNFQLSGNVFNNGAVPKTGKYYLGPGGDPNAFAQGDTQAIVGNFRYAYPGESGQRNNFRGDGFFNIDTGVNKNIKITERLNLQLSAYAFNVTNSVRFDAQTVNASLQNAQVFGTYSGVYTQSRRFEFAARLSF